MKLASVDIGSNTTLLSVVKKEKDTFHILQEEIYFTQLAENFSSQKRFTKEALHRLEDAFQKIKNIITQHQVTKIWIVATSASRQADNSSELFRIAKKYQLPQPEIISQLKEAKLTFEGSLFGLNQNNKHPLVIDIGGGSTEFSSHNQVYSLPIGSVIMTEKFKDNAEKLTLYAQKQLLPIQNFLNDSYTEIIFSAGTPVTLAFLEKNENDPKNIHGLKMTLQHVESWLHKLSLMSLKEKEQLPIPKPRARVIFSGLTLLKTILVSTKCTSFLVSTGGVRYGVILKKLKDMQDYTQSIN